MAGATMVYISRQGRKAAKITRADVNWRFDDAELRWPLKGAKRASATTYFLNSQIYTNAMGNG